MKYLSMVIIVLVALFGLALPGHATVLLDDVFTNGTSRLVQNLPTRSAWYTSSTTGSFTVSGGIMSLRIAGGSVAVVSYFVPNPASSPPVQLNVGDTLTATFRFAFPALPAGGPTSTSQGFKLGLFDFYDGTNALLRAVNDGSISSGGNANGQAVWVEGYALFGKMYQVFADDQPIDIRKRTLLPDNSLMGSSSDWTSIGKQHVDTNNFAGFDISTNYEFQAILQRTALDTMAVTMSWSNLSSGAVISSSTNDNVATNFYFDGIEFRPSNDGIAPSTNLFKKVKVEVTSAPVAASIITQPQDKAVASGENVTLTCKANGTLPLGYQWYFNTNTPLSGATINFPPAHTPTANPTLTITSAATTNAGSYSVIVSNDYGSVTSSVATLLVADLAPTVTTQPQDLTVIPGQYATFSVIATGSQPLSYQWYYNTSSLLTNTTGASFTLTNVQPGDAGTYSVIVSNPISTITSSNAVLTVDTTPSAPVFILQPVALALRQGTSGSFTAAAVGDQPISYQWNTNGLPIVGATTPTLNFPSAQPSDAGTYVLVASNAIGSTPSSNAVLSIAPRTPPLPVIPTNQFNILDYGGYGDGASNNAAAIQSTIAAAAAAGGGIVVVPTNDALNTYMSGPIVLSNSINLQVNSGAMLKMLPRFATPTVTNWPGSSFPLIDIGGVHDVAITGPGTIDGNGSFGSTGWWQNGLAESSRPKLINIHNSSLRVLIKNVTLQNSPVFHVLMKGGNQSVTLDGVTWNAPGNSPNTDAMDIGSTNVLIQNCTINVGDDNIEIGSSSDAAADITVSNCTFGTGHGVSIGSQTAGGVHELLVSNCWWSGTDYGIRLKSDRGEGGLVENLQYLDISMTNVGYALVIFSYYNQSFNGITPTAAANSNAFAVTPTTPIWRDITVSNLYVDSTSQANIAGTIWGVPEMVVSNVTLYNVVNTNTPGKTFNIYNARGIRIINSNLTAPNATTNTLNLYNAEILVTNTTPNTNLVTLGGLVRPGTNNSLAFFNARATITDPSMLGTGPITLGNSTLSFSPASLNSSNNPITVVDASTVAFTSGNNTLNGALSGSGALTLNLPASTLLTLRADSSGFGGALVVSNSGTLLVNNTVGSGTGSGAVTVLSTANLGGNGTIGGPVTVDGTLAPGTSPGTLTISNNLVVHSGAVLQYELGTSSDLVAVSGDLTLGGTLNVTDSGGFTDTTYPLTSYGGLLTYDVLTVGATPNAGFNYAVDTGTAGLVKLNVTVHLSPFEQWQVQYFGTTNNPAAAGSVDADGDGMSNTNEFLAGTSPTNSMSALRIISAVRQASDVKITWSTAGGRTNMVQASSGGVNGGYTNNFVDISGSTTIIPGSGDVTTNYVDVAGATNVPSRFYRVRLAP